jgi:hypothetical protein
VAIVGLHLLMTRPADPSAPSRDPFQVFTTFLEGGVLASTGSDVLVRSSGTLLVFGKGLCEPMSLASTDALRSRSRRTIDWKLTAARCQTGRAAAA